MISESLMLCSAGMLLVLGTLHLIYTFRGPKLLPRDPELRTHMQAVSPVITRETTMWRAWIGFNASHSMGAMLFGLIYGYLAHFQATLLFGSTFLLTVGLLMLGGFFLLARAYWFRIPLAGTAIALACYVLSIALSRL